MNRLPISNRRQGISLFLTLILVASTLWPGGLVARAESVSHLTVPESPRAQVLPTWWGETLSPPTGGGNGALAHRVLPAWWPPQAPLEISTERPLQQGLVDHFAFLDTPVSATAGEFFSATIEAQNGSGGHVSVDVTIDLTTTNGGTISPTTALMASGWWTEEIRLTTSGIGRVVSAISGTVTGQTSITITPASASAFVISPTQIETQTAGLDWGLDIAALDRYGNVATGYTDTATLTDTTGTIQPTALDFTDGIWSGVVSITGAATGVVISVTDGPISGTEGAFTVLPADLDRFVLSDTPPQVMAGVPFSDARVTAFDPYDNVKTDYAGAVYFVSDDPQATLPYTSGQPYTFQTTDNGEVTFDGFVLRETVTRHITVTDGTISAASGDILVQPGPLNRFTLAGYPSAVVAGDAWTGYTVTVTAYDGFDNLKTDYGGTIRFSSSDVLFDRPADYSFQTGDNGVRGFAGDQFALYHPPRQSVTVRDLATGISETSTLIDVAPGALDYFVIDMLDGEQVAGAPFQLIARAFDAWDNPKTNYTGQPALTDTTGTISPTQTNCSWATGSCTQSVVITRAGPGIRITVTDPGGISRASNLFEVVPATLDHIRVNGAPDNGGLLYGGPAEVGDHLMTLYMTYTVWGAGYDVYDNYREDLSLTWGLTGVLETAEIKPNPGISATLTPAPILSGTGGITATYVPSGLLDSTGVFTVQAPWLVIEKTRTFPPDGQVPAGSEMEYTIVYRNTGNADARDVRVTETYDSNVSFLWAVPLPDDGTDNVWSRPTLSRTQPPQTIKVLVQIEESLAPGTVVTNRVSIDGSRLGLASTLVTDVVTATPELQVSLSDLGNDPVNAGDPFNLQVTYANDGNGSLTGIVLTLTLDANLTFLGAGVTPAIAPTAGNGNIGRWELPPLGGYDDESFVVQVQADDFMADQYPLVNQGQIQSDQTLPAFDTEVTTVNAPVLTLSKSASSDPVVAYNTLTYTLVYSNEGHGPASALYITDRVPIDTSYADCSPAPCRLQGPIVIWQPGGLPAGASQAATMVVNVARNLDSGTLVTNQARIEVFNTPAYSASVRITTTVVSSPSLWLTMSNGQNGARAGDALGYILDYSNTGTGRAYGTTIVATPPDSSLVGDLSCWPTSMCQIQGGQVFYDVGTVPGGASANVGMSVTVHDPLPPGLHTLTATAVISTATPGEPPEGNAAQDVDPVITRPDLQISVDYDSYKPYPGKRITYTVHYTNAGRIETTGVIITALQPAHTTYDPMAGSQWQQLDDDTYAYVRDSLDFNQGGSLVFVVTLPTGTFTTTMPNFDSTFAIYDDGLSGAEAVPDDNRINAPLGLSNLAISNVAADRSIWEGQPGRLTVTVENMGSGTATGLHYEDGSFALDVFLDPTKPPASYPIEAFGEAYVYLNEMPPGSTANAVIYFTTNLKLSRGVPGFYQVVTPREMWVKVDNWGPLDRYQAADFALVPESNELDNVRGPIFSPFLSIYLPTLVKH